jgi:regulator of sigma E protease
MFFYFLIAILGLIFLMAIHELGHFLMAKKFGLTVEEFGIGLPPRIWGVKIKETLYSLNWLPLGAFVRIPELEGSPEERIESIPARQRIAIFLGGIIATWLTAVVIFSLVAGIWGLSFAATGNQPGQIQIAEVSPASPAQEAGLMIGDIILGTSDKPELIFEEPHQLISFLEENKGQFVELMIKRGKELILLEVRPALEEERAKDEGSLGIIIGTIYHQNYKWYQAPWAGLRATAIQTVTIPVLTAQMIHRLIQGEKIPGARVVGPIGIVQIVGEQAAIGWDRLLTLLAVIAIYFTIFNILPLPALDGGKVLFVGIEKIIGRKPNRVIENTINNIFFFLIIGLLIFVSIRDILYLIKPL